MNRPPGGTGSCVSSGTPSNRLSSRIVPVHGRGLVERVREVHHHLRALRDAKQRTGILAVEPVHDEVRPLNTRRDEARREPERIAGLQRHDLPRSRCGTVAVARRLEGTRSRSDEAPSRPGASTGSAASGSTSTGRPRPGRVGRPVYVSRTGVTRRPDRELHEIGRLEARAGDAPRSTTRPTVRDVSRRSAVTRMTNLSRSIAVAACVRSRQSRAWSGCMSGSRDPCDERCVQSERGRCGQSSQDGQS